MCVRLHKPLFLLFLLLSFSTLFEKLFCSYADIPLNGNKYKIYLIFSGSLFL